MKNTDGVNKFNVPIHNKASSSICNISPNFDINLRNKS
jgi:hypothetical protein